MEFQIRLLHLDQRGVGLYVVAGFHQNLLHRSGVIGYDGVFHLHRFEHGDLVTVEVEIATLRHCARIPNTEHKIKKAAIDRFIAKTFVQRYE